jgi:AraC-like DNA-binding protein
VRVSERHGYWLGENGALELGTGQVVALLPLRDGCFRASQTGAVTLHHFRFSPELAGGLITPVEHGIFESLASEPGHAMRSFPADAPGAAMWTQLLARSVTGSALLQRVELLRIVATLFAKELEQPAPVEKSFLSARQKLRLLFNEMPEAEFLKLSPRDLAIHCGVSLKQSNRSFRQLFGMSLPERQELVRLQKARQALADTTRSIHELALEAGFRDERHFIAAFDKQFGVSPSEWGRPRARRDKIEREPEPKGKPANG